MRQDTLNKEFIKAVETGDLLSLKQCFEEGVYVDVENGKRETALQVAARNGHLDCLKFLLDNGADINVDGCDSALFLSAKNNHVSCFEAIINKGADIDACLIWAMHKNDLNVAEFLLNNGASSNARNFLGESALIRTSDVKMERLLLSHGADVNAQNWSGWTKLHHESDYGDIDAMKRLLELGASPDIKNNKGWTPLMTAVSNGAIDKMKLLIEFLADVTLKNDDGETAIDIATKYASPAMINEIVLILENYPKVCRESHVLNQKIGDLSSSAESSMAF